MIKLFRTIRKSLIKKPGKNGEHVFLENRIGKYFIYAIGEIILVVIGILIALALNNCPEGTPSEERRSQNKGH